MRVAVLIATRWILTNLCRAFTHLASRCQTHAASLYAYELRLGSGPDEPDVYEEHRESTPRKKGWPGFRGVSDDAEVE